MPNTKRRATLAIDGYEVTASFADSRNAAAVNQVKQILLSSFANSATKARPEGILAILPEQRDNIGEGNPHVP